MTLSRRVKETKAGSEHKCTTCSAVPLEADPSMSSRCGLVSKRVLHEDRETKMNKEKSVKQLAEMVGRDWKTTPYYEDAEKYVSRFWHPAGHFRRLFDMMPRGTVLDLACGHGRLTKKLLHVADQVIGMDINTENIEYCQKRFADHPRLKLIEGNGYDFQAVDDDSLDTIICFDSMVHFDSDVVRSYLIDTSRVLKPGGMALFHHSNYTGAPTTLSYRSNPHARNFMSRDLFAHYAFKADLEIVEQIAINWGEYANLDCLSLLRR